MHKLTIVQPLLDTKNLPYFKDDSESVMGFVSYDN